MPMPAARVTNLVLQPTPHCHAPIHPPAPTPTPIPHPALPLMIIPPGAPTVLISNTPRRPNDRYDHALHAARLHSRRARDNHDGLPHGAHQQPARRARDQSDSSFQLRRAHPRSNGHGHASRRPHRPYLLSRVLRRAATPLRALRPIAQSVTATEASGDRSQSPPRFAARATC